MNFSIGKLTVSIILCLGLSLPFPQVAQAAQLQTTSQALLEISHQQAKSEVSSFFTKEEVRKMLFERGVTSEEIDQRLASLSDQEMQSLSVQVKEARAGGDILITVLVILLIIYFAKRI